MSLRPRSNAALIPFLSAQALTVLEVLPKGLARIQVNRHSDDVENHIVLRVFIFESRASIVVRSCSGVSDMVLCQF